MKIPIIDLFAGPGGLGEGFSAYQNKEAEQPFEVIKSIEKDQIAHKTLLLRSFIRKFPSDKKPEKYFKFIQTNWNLNKFNNLLDCKEGAEARREALCLELGKDNEVIDEEINQSLSEIILNNRHWVLIGGPPCQAYSLVGRSRNKGKQGWTLDNDYRSHLYQEYLKVIGRYQPSVFVMENVKGILSARLNEGLIFEKIIKDLERPNEVKLEGIVEPITGKKITYRLYSFVKEPELFINLKPKDYIIKSEDYGIPQNRHRVILLGIREDLNVKLTLLKKKEKKITVWEAIGDLPSVMSGISNRNINLSEFDQQLKKYAEIQEMLSSEFKKLVLDNDVSKVIKKRIYQINKNNGRKPSVFNKEWFLCEDLNGHICNHESRNHIRSDLLRYFFVSCFGEAKDRTPKLSEWPGELFPDHKNAKSGHFEDRFRVQLRNEPSTTITCHIAKDGHYYIHPDPRQCRSLTVREAARLQTFPDDYFFCGNKTSQYQQVGNAVPPLLAYQLADVVFKVLED